MANTKKAAVLIRELGDKLQKRIGTGTTANLAFVLAIDAADGNPYWTIGAGSPGGKNAVIKILPTPWTLAKDILGNSANLYANHTIQLGTEAPAAGSGAGVFLDLPTLLPIMFEALSLGAKLEWYQSTTGSAPTLANSVNTAGNLKTSVDSLYWPLISSS